jgi:RNA polymerase sigma factor for flagellar operon FliA
MTARNPGARAADNQGMKQYVSSRPARPISKRSASPSPATSPATLLEQNLDLAEQVARLVFARVRDYFELDELVSLAAIGIAEAAERYDAARGVPFRAFAWYRARGAVMDGVRDAVQEMMYLPTRTRRALLALEGAGAYLEHRGEVVVDAPLATTAAIVTELRDGLSAVWTSYATAFAGEKGEPAIEDGAAERIDRARLTAKVRRAMAALPRRERALMSKHYWQGRNLVDAGAELGLTKQAASRLHARAVERLRDGLAADARKRRVQRARAATKSKARSDKKAA